MAPQQTLLTSDLAGSALDPGVPWRESSGGGWATAVALLLLLIWQMLRLFASHRRQTASGSPVPPPASTATESSEGGAVSGVSELISDAELRELIVSLEGKLETDDKWEHVIEKSSDLVSYTAKCCRPKDEPLKYLSITTFEKCSVDLLRDFYMDSEYRKIWDKVLIQYDQLLVDENGGIEIGRLIKKFPLMTPREYVLAWRLWEGKDKTFYCLTKDCEHPLACRQNKYVRVSFYKSGWRLRKVPGRDACEITIVHQEDAGLNNEIAKVAFAKGIWSYVCKMNSALREYSSQPSRSKSVPSLLRLTKKVPPEFEVNSETSIEEVTERSAVDYSRHSLVDTSERKSLVLSKKWIANGLLLVGGIVCLSRGRSIGTQLAVACILKKLMKHRTDSNGVESTKPTPKRRHTQNIV